MRRSFVAFAMLLIAQPASRADEGGWIKLLDGDKLDAFRPVKADWYFADSVALDEKNPKLLAGKPGSGILVNGPKGRTADLYTKQAFGDVEVHLEFAIGKGSNSGIKFQEVYEVQILDSFGKKELTGDDCGGIYPRAELKPKYRHIDKGIAPKVNAAKAAGEWQTLDVVWKAPRFNDQGEKTANAKIVKATLNGQVIHENQELQTPTGNNWEKKEKPTGALMLQGDHGPVAFRNFRVKPLGKLNLLRD